MHKFISIWRINVTNDPGRHSDVSYISFPVKGREIKKEKTDKNDNGFPQVCHFETRTRGGGDSTSNSDR